MIAYVLALGVLLQGAPAARPGAPARTAVVTGQVQSPAGAAAQAVRVSAIPAPPPGIRGSDGSQYYDNPQPVSMTLTDEQGRYKLERIPAGRYYIVAGFLGQATFYPQTTDAEKAEVVTIAADTTTNDINVKMLLPVGGRVGGRVTPANPNLQERAVLSGTRLAEILEVPITREGTFDFGHVPSGTYLLNLFPTYPGLASQAFRVGDNDVASLQFTRPELHTVSGKIVVENGPLPYALLAFSTDRDYVAAPIAPDLNFRVQLPAGRHQIELGGMPVGYGISTARTGTQDVTRGLTVGNADVNDLVITVGTPRALPHVRGKLTGMPSGASVEMSGPIVGKLSAPMKADGSFDFGSLPPGTYTLTVPQAPNLPPRLVVVQWADVDVTNP